MLRKAIHILLFVPVIYLVAMPVYFYVSSKSKLCGGFAIHLKDSSEYHFVTKRHLLNLAYGNSGKMIGKPAGKISVADIEGRIKTLRELLVAEVYMGIDGTIHIYADQREPVMRVMPENGGDFFIDEEGVVIRRRNLYTPRLHIVGGNVNITASMLNGISVLDTSIKHTILKDIYYLVEYLNNDSFWSAQIDQIYVDNNDDIKLIPRVGNHQILLGSTEDYKAKFRKLEDFYDKVLPEVGWNKYSVINLEYKDQIVCKRR